MARTKVWTEKKLERVSERLKCGMSPKRIAQDMDVTVNQIYWALRILGESTAPTWTEEEDQKLRDMAAQGMNKFEISEALGRTFGAVKTRAGYLKVSLPRYTRKNPPQKRQRQKPPAPRRCLMHGGQFRPRHKAEFVCPACKSSRVWKSGPDMGLAI